jgi:hypothetical protein
MARFERGHLDHDIEDLLGEVGPAGGRGWSAHKFSFRHSFWLMINRWQMVSLNQRGQ